MSNREKRGGAPSVEEEKPKTPLERIQDAKKAAQMSESLGFAIEKVSQLEILVRFAEKYITSKNSKLREAAKGIMEYFEGIERYLKNLESAPPESEIFAEKAKKLEDELMEHWRAILQCEDEPGFSAADFEKLKGEKE